MDPVSTNKVRFQFVTQVPRDDGCGVFVLQMLTGKPYDLLARMIDWGDQTNHYTTWVELRAVLKQLGWRTSELLRSTEWAEIKGIAIVHVEGDHFVLFDADNGVFYDPGLTDGPQVTTSHTPLSHLLVNPPGS